MGNIMKNKKVYLLVGLTGAGKSTTGNCVLNNSGKLAKEAKEPFLTSDSSEGCTRNFAYQANEQVFVLDTMGFGDPNFRQAEILKNLKKARKKVENQVDRIVFMLKKGRLTNETVEFFDLVQDKILKGMCKYNTILIITHCNDSKWARNQLKNKHFARLVKSCGGIQNTHCFYLKCDGAKKVNEQQRGEAIRRLHTFLNRQSYHKVDLSHIQRREFKLEWEADIIPFLKTIFSITNGCIQQ
jgi:GTPase Era involved in 16S rRNA processing